MKKIQKGLLKISIFDIILIILIICASTSSIILFRTQNHAPAEKNRKVVVWQNGRVLDSFGLEEDGERSFLDERFIIEAQGGRLRVRESDCRQKICVNRGWTSQAGERIVCVPNKLYVEISTEGSLLLDAICY